MKNRELLNKNGFVVIKNLLSPKLIKKLTKQSKKLHKNNLSKFTPLHNNGDHWKLISNKTIVNVIKDLLNNKKISYLFNSHSVCQKKNTFVDTSWHRDNVCRDFGKGPDWYGNYNVLRVAIYLNQKGKNGLNIIKKSHIKKKFLCFFLKFLRTHFKKIYFNKFFRFIFDSLIGTKVYAKPGDCVFFFANLYHSAIVDVNGSQSPRRAIFLTFGTDNNHSKNYINYYLYHRKDLAISKGIKDDKKFNKFLKTNKIDINYSKKKYQIKYSSL